MESLPSASRPSTPALIVITLIVCITLYLIVYRIYPGANNQNVLQKRVPLRETKNVLTPDRVQTELLGSSGCTVMGFFYLAHGDKTLRHAPADSYVPLLQVENNWVVEVAPSPKEKNGHGARLRVQTQRAGSMTYEVIPLPSFPKQRWVHLALLREGRRFDVLYDSRIVASYRLEHYPVVIASPLSVGGKGLEGTALHLRINSRRLSPEEVERERKTYADTNGRVTDEREEPSNEDMSSWFGSWNPLASLFRSLLTECPAGLPCETVTAPPSKALYEWKTPYA